LNQQQDWVNEIINKILYIIQCIISTGERYFERDL